MGNKGWSSSLDVGWHCKKPACYKVLHRALGGLLWTS